MRIRFNEELGTLEIDGRMISAAVLREIVDPNRRMLFRFERIDGVIQATAYTEGQVIWIDKERDPDRVATLEVKTKNSNEEEASQ